MQCEQKADTVKQKCAGSGGYSGIIHIHQHFELPEGGGGLGGHVLEGRECRGAVKQSHCPPSPSPMAVQWRSPVAHCSRGMWRCKERVPLPTTPKQCGRQGNEAKSRRSSNAYYGGGLDPMWGRGGCTSLSRTTQPKLPVRIREQSRAKPPRRTPKDKNQGNKTRNII